MSAKPVDNVCHEHPRTRQRLLEAAGEVFAEHGFRGATIRDICNRAEANVAAVNYHFRDKEGLYEACLHHWLDEASAKYPLDDGVTPESKPELRLRTFVRALMFRMLDRGRPTWHGKLIARNMIESTPFLDTCIDSYVRPTWEVLRAIVRDVLGSAASSDDIRNAVASVLGQIVFYRNTQHVILRIFPEIDYSSEQLEQLAEHITQFSLAGLNATANRVAAASTSGTQTIAAPGTID